MQTHITLYNAEFMIEPCVRAVRRVFPDVIVHDFGSEDGGPDTVTKMGVPLIKHGRLSGEDYVFLKQEESIKSDRVFWVDADEVWPQSCLENVRGGLMYHSLIVGFWKNLKVRCGHIYESDYMHRGAIAWDTKLFGLHRTWPREKLREISTVSRKEAEYTPAHEDVFCYHGVLLNLSPLPDKKNRWKKRAERDDQSANLKWEIRKDLPFAYSDSRILGIPAFEWYK